MSGSVSMSVTVLSGSVDESVVISGSLSAYAYVSVTVSGLLSGSIYVSVTVFGYLPCSAVYVFM